MSGYKKLFEIEAFKPNPADLEKLAQFMTRTGKFFDVLPSLSESIQPLEAEIGFKPPKSMSEILELLNKTVLSFDTLELLDKDLQDSEIPAGYSYLGQFILHDISFDERTDRFEKTHYPWEPLPTGQLIKNKHKPFLDLETIYGPEAEPESRLLEEHSSRLRLGSTIKNTAAIPGALLSERSFPNDLLRKENNVKADIIDPRNDGNLLLAQTQVAFTKFHNAIVYKLGNPNSTAVFEKARKMTIRHYQYIILTDFLPRITQGGKSAIDKIVSEIQNGANKFYHPTKDDMFVPVEFTVGAYRTAHSMIRHTYNLNKEVNNREATLRELFLFTGQGAMNLTDRKKLPSRWIVNWKWFYDIDNSISTEASFNFARKIDTNLSSILGMLLPGGRESRANSLSALDLYRGVAWGLPTGQSLAKTMATIDPEIRVLTSKQIESKFDKPLIPGQPVFTVLDADQRKFFTENTPLLFYLLAEAEEQCKGETLGDVGSRIVAETLVKLIYETPDSILKKGQELESDEDFLPNDPEVFQILKTKDKKTFGMPEMLKFIAKSRKNFAVIGEDFNELNPLG